MVEHVSIWRASAMSVRKRTWKTREGEVREAWVVDYSDQLGHRHLKTFARKRDADSYHAQVVVDVGAGVHTAESRSLTISEAGRLWIESREAAKLERTTLEQYQRQLDLHITPLIGLTRLSALTVPMVRTFEDKLREDRSPAMVRKIMVSLSAILSDAQERGLVAQNVARHLRTTRRGREDRTDKRQKGKLRVGVDIPTPNEMRTIVAHLASPARP